MSDSPIRTTRAALIVLLYLFAGIVGVRTALFREPQPVDVLVSLGVAAVTTLACITDAKVLGKHILYSVRFVMLFTWPLSPVLYVLSARGWKGVFWFLLHGVLLVGLYWGCYYFTALSVYRDG